MLRAETAGPFVSCEDALAPVAGLHNFYATVTSVPLLGVPLYSLWLAVRRSSPPADAGALRIHGSLVVWLVSLTGLFGTNLNQHIAGGAFSFRVHEMMAAIQSLWFACLLNALSRRVGGRWTVDERSALAAAVLASAGVLTASLRSAPPDLQPPMCGVVQAVTAPFIVGTMGRLSWTTDARAWALFVRSCVGLVLVHIAVAVERAVCAPLGGARTPIVVLIVGPIPYNASVQHLCNAACVLLCFCASAHPIACPRGRRCGALPCDRRPRLHLVPLRRRELECGPSRRPSLMRPLCCRSSRRYGGRTGRRPQNAVMAEPSLSRNPSKMGLCGMKTSFL
jgi:hypothetical protein